MTFSIVTEVVDNIDSNENKRVLPVRYKLGFDMVTNILDNVCLIVVNDEKVN